MITDIYRKYFQKSYNFLYPLLGFKKHKTHKPLQTYVEWEGICDVSSRKLICIFKRLHTEEWIRFEQDYLICHRMLESCLPLDDDLIVYVFNFNTIAEDFDSFCNAQYSKISQNSKKILSTYYGVHTPEWVYMESYLYPEKYFKIYAEILKVDIDNLKEVGELCEKYDLDKETCKVIQPEVQL